MNEKEVAELRRRYRADRSNITRIRGCYVSEDKKILSQFNQSLCLFSEEETEEMLKILKKTLSGGIGKNLVQISFTNQQVLEGEEHRLLMRLRDSELTDDEAISSLYEKMIQSIDMEGSYLILLAHDKYDVFSKGKDGQREEDSSSVFSYLLCAVCPVKLTKPQLSYSSGESAFKNVAVSSVVAPPETGFLFPTFDDRSANLYHALFYTKTLSDDHAKLIDSVFRTPVPMPAEVQRSVFQSLLSKNVPEAEKLDFVQDLQDKIVDVIDEYYEGEETEPLTVAPEKMESILVECGAEKKNAEAFREEYASTFGETSLSPQNLFDQRKFEVKMPDVVIKVNPESRDLVRTEVIDGLKYILIRADSDVEVNGMSIKITKKD